MTIENDNLIELKLKQKQHQQQQQYNNGVNSMSKLVTNNHKLMSLKTLTPTSTSSPSTSPSLSSPSSSSTSSLSSSSYSLTSGFSSNLNSTKTNDILLEDSFSKRPTLLSELVSYKKTYDPNTNSSSKFSLLSNESTLIDHFTELSLEKQTSLIEKWVPFCEIQQKIIVPDADPKKFIFNYNSPNLSAKKELNYLGIVDVNPDEYTLKYGAELRAASDLPKYILDIKTPDNLRLAADVPEPDVHELEGDIEALKLIDLEREDLGVYRQYLRRIGIVS